MPITAGQLDREQNAIYRDTAHVWGLSCSLLSSEIYRLAAEQVGGTPQMDATSNLLAPGMVRFRFFREYRLPVTVFVKNIRILGGDVLLKQFSLKKLWTCCLS